MANEKLKTLQIDDTAMDTPGGSGLKHLEDATADGSLRGNTAQAENASYSVGAGSTAIGKSSTAKGENAYALGRAVNANGDASFASGSYGEANGYASMVAGSQCKATGDYSFARGVRAYATFYASSAQGIDSVAKGYHATAFGDHSTAQGIDQFVVGRYNIEQGNPNTHDETTKAGRAFIVGNGTSESRSNAFSVAWNGSVYGIPQTATNNFFAINSTNFELTTQQAVWWGPIMQINLIVKNKASISVPANGNITNLQVGTLATGYRPVFRSAAHSLGDSAGQAWYTITNTGVISLGAIEGTGTARTIASGQTFDICATFIRTMGSDT